MAGSGLPAYVPLEAMEMGPIQSRLEADHRRLEALLAQAVAGPAGVERGAFDNFRAGLLRHIAMEEKVLVPELRRRGAAPERVLARLRADHAALAGLLLPSPTREDVETIRSILLAHNPLEEGPGGLYAACDAWGGETVDALVARMDAIPAVKVAPYRDDPQVRRHVARLLADRAALLADGPP